MSQKTKIAESEFRYFENSYVDPHGRLFDAATMEQIAPERRKLPPGPALDQIRGDMVHAHCRCGR